MRTLNNNIEEQKQNKNNKDHEFISSLETSLNEKKLKLQALTKEEAAETDFTDKKENKDKDKNQRDPIYILQEAENLFYYDCKEAAVIGDTIGDPLKDTSGPSINILIKLSSIISVVFGSLFVKPLISQSI